jgi:hypothetical protein
VTADVAIGSEQITAISDAVIAGIGQPVTAGAGASECVYTCEDNSGAPIENVGVWITTDSAGAHVYAGTLYTDSDGEVKFMLDVGNTYYVWRQKGGVNFTNPQTWSV